MKYLNFFAAIAILFALFSCSKPAPRPDVKIIPQPAVLINLEGTFTLNSGTKILINNESKEMKNIASVLSRHLETFYGLKNNRVAYSLMN